MSADEKVVGWGNLQEPQNPNKYDANYVILGWIAAQLSPCNAVNQVDWLSELTKAAD